MTVVEARSVAIIKPSAWRSKNIIKVIHIISDVDLLATHMPYD